MAIGGLDVGASSNEEHSVDVVAGGMDRLGFGVGSSSSSSSNGSSQSQINNRGKKEEEEEEEEIDCNSDGGGVEITCFSEALDDAVLHFQIIRLPKQIYAWIGCNSAKFGHLYAATPTCPENTVGVTSILGGASDNTGSGIARRLVLKTGLNVILACNIPKNSPMLEADAEKKLVEKLIKLGYTRPKSNGLLLSGLHKRRG